MTENVDVIDQDIFGGKEKVKPSDKIRGLSPEPSSMSSVDDIIVIDGVEYEKRDSADGLPGPFETVDTDKDGTVFVYIRPKRKRREKKVTER